MWRILKKKVAAGMMAAMLMLVNVVMPVQPVFAFEGEEENNLLSQEMTTTTPVDDSELATEDTNQPTEGNVSQLAAVQSHKVKIDKAYKVTLCHRTDSATNPYVEITVNYNAFTKRGHDTHDGQVVASIAEAKQLKLDGIMWGDIIPAVPEWDYAGENVSEGQSILDNNCRVEGQLSLPEVSPADPCGLDNAYWDVDALNADEDYEHVTFILRKNGDLVVKADEGYIFKIGDRTLSRYNYGPAVDDPDNLCEAASERPNFVELCGTTKDYYIVKDTENVAYYNGDELLTAGDKYYVTDASEVTITAKVTDDDYEIVNQTEYTKQFTDKACRAKVDLETGAWCAGVDTMIEAELTNTTKSWQAYEVVVSDESGELASKVVTVPAGETTDLERVFEGDGEFTVSIYSYNKEKRGKLLAEQTVMTECVDTFTPEIYKKNQDGAILSTGTFDVEVCQNSSEFDRMVMGEEQDGCTTYEDVMFGTDGSWFANNVEYERNVPTTVTITETKAPVGCAMSTTPWVFTWNYSDIQVMSYYHMSGSWDTADGTNVFNLYNNCDKPGQGEYTPDPVTPVVPVEVETLAETGESENALLAVAAGMLLASVGLALSPRLYRGQA